MRRFQSLTAIVVFFFVLSVQAQTETQCQLCKMDIEDIQHKAYAKNDKQTFHFDAIECLINYLKDVDESEFGHGDDMECERPVSNR